MISSGLTVGMGSLKGFTGASAGIDSLLGFTTEELSVSVLRPQGGVPVKKFVIHDFHIWDSVFRELSRDELLLC